MGGQTPYAALRNMFNKVKPYLSMVSLQFGYAGMFIISMVSLKHGMSNFILPTYRHLAAIITIAPFAFLLERKIRPKMTLPIFLMIVILGFLEPVLDQNLYFLGMNPSAAHSATPAMSSSLVDGGVDTYRPPSNTRGRGRGHSSGSQFQCQLCGKQGHLVDRCYYRFDASYKSASYKPPPPQANLCMYGPGSPMVPWSHSFPVTPSSAPSVPSSGWYFSPAPAPTWYNPFLVNAPQPALASCNVPLGSTNELSHCIACHLGKEHKFPFLKSSTQYTAPLQLVVANVLVQEAAASCY
ncbi:hypothetical protein GOBAR_AA16824 [Gossypium barbadense]|uniref:CCHC-type domain-containing protein n=1 Tax=Gossypium barbadense TaxID=3634 RepID=A0A2P5XKH2_GOSBA|nr:hypothetical protein GOBAR_AA16824 [Gossypium barbadense]